MLASSLTGLPRFPLSCPCPGLSPRAHLAAAGPRLHEVSFSTGPLNHGRLPHGCGPPPGCGPKARMTDLCGSLWSVFSEPRPSGVSGISSNLPLRSPRPSASPALTGPGPLPPSLTPQLTARRSPPSPGLPLLSTLHTPLPHAGPAHHPWARRKLPHSASKGSECHTLPQGFPSQRAGEVGA